MRSLQSGNSLLKNCKLLFQNPRLLDQFGMEFIEFSKCLEFHEEDYVNKRRNTIGC
jgi:hypothetical protein